MSGVLKSLGKVFRATVVKPFKAVDKLAKKVVHTVMSTPILKYVAIAVAIYFTAGAAMAYFGAAGAAGGVAAAGGAAAGATGSIAIGAGSVVGGTAITAGTAAAAAGGTAFAAGAAATTLATVNVSADAVAVGAGLSAGQVAAISVGTAASAVTAMQSGQVADNAMTQGQGAVTGTPGVTNLAAVQVNASIPPIEGSEFAGTYGGDLGLDTALNVSDMSPTFDSSPSDIERQDPSKNADGSPKSLFQRSSDYVKNKVGMSGSPNATIDSKGALDTDNLAAAAPAPSGAGGLLGGSGRAGGMSTFEKAMLLKSGVDLATGLLKKPEPQMQYSGVDDNGNGAGLGIHTVNGGYGLATGGHEPAPNGVPPALLPPGASQGVAGAGMNAGAAGAAGASGAPTGNPGVGGLTGATYAAGMSPPASPAGLVPTRSA